MHLSSLAVASFLLPLVVADLPTLTVRPNFNVDLPGPTPSHVVPSIPKLLAPTAINQLSYAVKIAGGASQLFRVLVAPVVQAVTPTLTDDVLAIIGQEVAAVGRGPALAKSAAAGGLMGGVPSLSMGSAVLPNIVGSPGIKALVAAGASETTMAPAAVASSVADAASSLKVTCLDSTATDVTITSLFYYGPIGMAVFLCPGATILTTNPIFFSHANQTLATLGYPTDDSRATIVVTGSDQSIAVYGSSDGTDYIALRNLQINGNRPALGRLSQGSALIEFGGNTVGQVIDQVKVYEPRGWSCLHGIEGYQNSCRGIQITNNQIGPSGNGPTGPNQFRRKRDNIYHAPGEWADGISIACQGSLIENNIITDATDGGIVIFGAPHTVVRDNQIITSQRQMLGGVNMVDFAPYAGDYTGVQVYHNTFNTASNFMKLGVAMGPNVWGVYNVTEQYRTFAGAVYDNTFTSGTGYFGYAVGIAGHENATVLNNVMSGANFGGVPSQACYYPNPSPRPFVIDPYTTPGSVVQSDFLHQSCILLICYGPGPVSRTVTSSTS